MWPIVKNILVVHQDKNLICWFLFTDLIGYECKPFPQGIVAADWSSVVIANVLQYIWSKFSHKCLSYIL